MHACRQTDSQLASQTDSQLARQTDSQLARQTDRHTDIHTYMHACIHAYMHTCIHAYMLMMLAQVVSNNDCCCTLLGCLWPRQRPTCGLARETAAAVDRDLEQQGSWLCCAAVLMTG